MTYEEFEMSYRRAAVTGGLPETFYGEEPTRRLWIVTEKLAENGRRFNLTAIRDPEEVIRKHLIDSLLPLALLRDNGIAFSSLLDIGTGGGFPLLPMACVLEGEETRLTGLDATAKKIAHVKETAAVCGLTSVSAVCGRAEELAAGPMRESFDLVTARAVAEMPVLLEIGGAFVKPGGFFCALKGKAEEEIREAETAAGRLGFADASVIPYEIPGGDARCLVLYRKTGPTPKIYPRRYSEILKRPLNGRNESRSA